MAVTFLLYIEFANRNLIRREDDDAMVLIITLLFISFSSPKMLGKSEVCLCYGHKSSTGTIRRLFHKNSYESTAPVRRPAGGRKNRTIFDQLFGHRTVPGKV